MKENRLSVLKNSVPRKVFGPKRNDIRGDLRGWHKEELCNLSTLPNIRAIK
jgi:hypothetical protein